MYPFKIKFDRKGTTYYPNFRRFSSNKTGKT